MGESTVASTRTGIGRLLIRYLLLAIGIVLLNFLIPRLLPGDPLAFSSSEGIDPAVPLSDTARQQLRAYYHLDEPLHVQFGSYLADLVRGDLGWSISRSAPVGLLVVDRLPWTLALLLPTLLLAALIGTILGVASGWRPDGIHGPVIDSIASFLAAIPEFLMAIGLLLVFAVGLGWFPLFGGQTVFASDPNSTVNIWESLLDVGWHLTLPAITLALVGASGFALLARDAMATLRYEPWLMTARAKGLSDRQLIVRHALPNIVSPLLTFFGLRLGAVLGGAIVVERVFGIPGLGLLAFQAVRARDYPVLQSLFLLTSLGVLVANLAVEILYLRVESRRGAAYG